MWTYADGVYDGDYDTSSDMGRLNHSDRFGSSLCEGKSLKLRYGGGPNTATGGWEVVSHGKVSMYSTSNTLNFFSVQGSGGTGMGTYHAASTRLGGGGWTPVTASTSSCNNAVEMRTNYGGADRGCFRDGISTLGNASLTAITTDGLNA